jgi:glycosyltransferase involved in cell wall biosynthesis
MPENQPIRVVSLMEAYSVTGPAKNLIRFAVRARSPEPGQRAVDLSFLTFARGEENASNHFVQAARAAGIEVDVVPERFRFDPAILSGFSAVLKRRNPDIVQTHAIKGHFLFWAARLHERYRWLAFHHGYTAENVKMQIYNRLNRFSVPAAHGVVTVCSPFADMLETRLGVDRSRIAVVPNSIDPFDTVPLPAIDALRNELGIAPSGRVLLSVGRFSAEKGHADLIPAMQRLKTLLPGVALKHVLVGDGIERNNIERAAAAAGVLEHIVFAGHRRDVHPFYAMADIFVLPSHSEGSPNVLLEAMAAGLPSVATAVGGVPETVQDRRTALVVPPREPERLARAIAELVERPDLARTLAAAASADVIQRFSPEAYQRSIVSVYERLCAPSPALAAPAR